MDIPVIESALSLDEKQELLNSVLGQLASEQLSSVDDYSSAARFFLDLYEGGFRHRYAEIYGVMSVTLPEVAVQERCSCLVENLRALLSDEWALVRDFGNDRLELAKLRESASYRKLLDHVDLEARRLSTTESRMQSAVQALSRAEETVTSVRDETNKANKRLSKSMRKVENLQKETISVLGIFAAIVLVFNGSIGFSASTIEALGVAPDLRSMIMLCSLIGFVLINAIAILLSFISVMTGTAIKDSAKSERGLFKRLPAELLLAIAVIDACLVSVFALAAMGRIPALGIIALTE